MVGKINQKLKSLTALTMLVTLLGCEVKVSNSNSYKSENLVIENLAENVFLHISYFTSEKWGKVACNGVIFKSEDEVVVVDTPTDDDASRELITWIQDEWKCKVVAVVATHFHEDCVGGLNEFHKRRIPLFSHQKTKEKAKSQGLPVPQTGFPDYYEIEVGNKFVINRFFGPGHTSDNIISYFPSSNALFAGCLIKSVGAGKGNLADADTIAWSETVARILKEYGDVLVVPGHGKSGGK